jgi:hypothetical protein
MERGREDTDVGTTLQIKTPVETGAFDSACSNNLMDLTHVLCHITIAVMNIPGQRLHVLMTSDLLDHQHVG